MTSIQTVAVQAVNLFLLVLFVQAVASWFPSEGAGKVRRVCATVTEPVVRPVRRVLPPLRVGGAGVDLSFLVIFLAARYLVIPLIGAL